MAKTNFSFLNLTRVFRTSTKNSNSDDIFMSEVKYVNVCVCESEVSITLDFEISQRYNLHSSLIAIVKKL